MLASALIALLLGAPAHAVELGAGFRDATPEPGTVEGPRLLLRAPVGRVAVEAELYASAHPTRPGDLEEVLLAIAHTGESTAVDYRRDRYTAAVLVGPPPLLAPGLRARPVVSGGLEVRVWASHRIVSTTSASDYEVERGTTRVGLGPVAGVGVEIAADRMTARATVRDRLMLSWVDRELFGSHDPTFTLDLLVDLGGRP